jgi:hypothetical protein
LNAGIFEESLSMILISLMLAATPTPAVKPEAVSGSESARPRPAPSAKRSKRLIELEAAVNSLPLAAAEPGRTPGPEGL